LDYIFSKKKIHEHFSSQKSLKTQKNPLLGRNLENLGDYFMFFFHKIIFISFKTSLKKFVILEGLGKK